MGKSVDTGSLMLVRVTGLWPSCTGTGPQWVELWPNMKGLGADKIQGSLSFFQKSLLAMGMSVLMGQQRNGRKTLACPVPSLSLFLPALYCLWSMSFSSVVVGAARSRGKNTCESLSLGTSHVSLGWLVLTFDRRTPLSLFYPLHVSLPSADSHSFFLYLFHLWLLLKL